MKINKTVEKKLDTLYNNFDHKFLNKSLNLYLEHWIDHIWSIQESCEHTTINNDSSKFDEIIGLLDKRVELPEYFLNQFSNLYTKVDRMSDKIVQSQHSGVTGENMVLETLRESMTNRSITDTHSIPHSGDILVHDIYTDTRVLIEVKNYKNSVSKKETDKFISDMDHCANCQGGVFLSLFSKIANHGLFDIEIKNNRVYIYASQVSMNQYSIISTILFCEFIIHKIRQSNQNDTGRLLDNFNKIKDRFIKTIGILGDNQKDIQTIQTTCKKMTARQSELQTELKMLLETIN